MRLRIAFFRKTTKDSLDVFQAAILSRVRLKALHRSGYSSVAGKVGPITAVKTGPGECP